MEKNIICTNCPMGCYLTVTLEDNKVIDVTGNLCGRGKLYAEKECTNPERMVTSTVKLLNSKSKRLPVKTSRPIPKDKIFDCVKQLSGLAVKAPIKVGDTIVENICGTNISILATSTMDTNK